MRKAIRITSLLNTLIREHLVYVFLVAILIIAIVVSPKFFQPKNLFNILRHASALGVLAIGQTVVIISGGIDLSVAAVMQLAVVSIAEMTKGQNDLVWIALPTVLLAGILIGAGNGILVAKRKVQPFISTLFAGLLVTGLRLSGRPGRCGSGGLPEVRGSGDRHRVRPRLYRRSCGGRSGSRRGKG